MRFPIPSENDLRVVYFGGGLRVPIRGGLSVFGDARAMLALEGGDGLLGVWPVRAGVAWRFSGKDVTRAADRRQRTEHEQYHGDRDQCCAHRCVRKVVRSLSENSIARRKCSSSG